MKQRTTDKDLVTIARRLEVVRRQMDRLINLVQDSDHPNAADLAEDLFDQCWFAAWPEHVVRRHLEAPEKWQTGDFGIRRKRRLDDPDHVDTIYSGGGSLDFEEGDLPV